MDEEKGEEDLLFSIVYCIFAIRRKGYSDVIRVPVESPFMFHLKLYSYDEKAIYFVACTHFIFVGCQQWVRQPHQPD